MAARAGATMADMEFVQFHPTALADRRRSDAAGHRSRSRRRRDARQRFGRTLHARDRSRRRARAARRRRARDFRADATRTQRRLDARCAIGDSFSERFPTVFGFCMKAGIDPRSQRIPVAPAAHYHMGGIAVDEWGRSSLPGLWACGEVERDGRARRQSPRQQFAARSPGLRFARRNRHRQCRKREPAGCRHRPAAAPRRNENAFNDRRPSAERRPQCHVLQRRPGAQRARDARRASARRRARRGGARTTFAICWWSAGSSPKPRSRAARAAAAITAPIYLNPMKPSQSGTFTRLRSVA